MADATDSKSVGSDTVWVQVPPSAPKIKDTHQGILYFFDLEFRWDLRVEPRTGVSVLPYGAGNLLISQAKWVIDNYPAGRAAKGAVPPSAPKIKDTRLSILYFFILE